jgi:hypothetical protein
MPDREPAQHWILQFDSIHHVLAAERVFVLQQLWYDLVPTPREIHSDCGMVIQFHPDDRRAVCQLVAELPHRPGGVFRATPDGYQRVPATEL